MFLSTIKVPLLKGKAHFPLMAQSAVEPASALHRSTSSNEICHKIYTLGIKVLQKQKNCLSLHITCGARRYKAKKQNVVSYGKELKDILQVVEISTTFAASDMLTARVYEFNDISEKSHIKWIEIY